LTLLALVLGPVCAVRVANMELEEGFVCPPECQECCDKSPKEFTCVLRMPVGHGMPADRTCYDQKPREQGEVQAEVTCEYSQHELNYRLNEGDELNTKCSSKTRCCCDQEGRGMCVGDTFHMSRLQRQYAPAADGNLSLAELFPLTVGQPPLLNNFGMCPPGFSDWADGVDEPCHCDAACSSIQKWPPAERAAANAHIWKQMVGMAAGVYGGEPTISGWKLEKLWDISEDTWINKVGAVDYVGIYRRTQTSWTPEGDRNDVKECALAFAGTDDLFNVAADVFGWLRWASSWCGFGGVHASFASYMNTFLRGRRYHEYDSFLANKTECDRVITVGHSLGGSLASLLSGCANWPLHEDVLAASGLPNISFHVDAVYTFAAAGVSNTVAENPHPGCQHGCFEGARFFLQRVTQSSFWGEKTYVDPVPNLGSFRPYPLRHPKMHVVALTEMVRPEGGKDYKWEFSPRCVADCEGGDSTEHRRMMQGPWGVFGYKWDWGMHETKEYYRALIEASDLPDAEDSADLFDTFATALGS